jgi:hypothetical protein
VLSLYKAKTSAGTTPRKAPEYLVLAAFICVYLRPLKGFDIPLTAKKHT